MRRLIYLGPTLLLLWYADNVVTKDRTIGWERGAVFGSRRQWEHATARGAVVLGSSTTADWLSPDLLARIGLPRGSVVDAHLNGCHQGCTFAEVRALLAKRRRYDRAIFGTNQFQLCEYAHSKRVLQQRLLLPSRDLPVLLALYTHAEQPLTYVARYFGGVISGTYADTAVIRREWGTAVFGPTRPGAAHRWARPTAAAHAPGAPRSALDLCTYEPEQIAYKRAVSAALFDDLKRLAHRSYLLLLPDQTLSDDNPAHRAYWRRHRALHRELVAGRPWMVLVDLTRDGAHRPEHFRDGFHVSAQGARLQQALFVRRLGEMGELSAK